MRQGSRRYLRFAVMFGCLVLLLVVYGLQEPAGTVASEVSTSHEQVGAAGADARLPTSTPLPTRTVAPDKAAPGWIPAELSIAVQTDAAHVVPYALVEGDCGFRGRSDADGIFVGLLAAGPCVVQAMREDGLLRVWSEPVPIELVPGEGHEVTLVLPDEVQGGVGVAVRSVEGGVEIAAIRPSSPAEAEGLEVGDIVTHVDGRQTAGWSPREFAAQTMGPIDTSVELRVEARRTDTGRSTSTLTVTRIWLPPGSAASAQGGQLSVQSLTDTQRRELEAIRDEYNALVSDGSIDPEHPELERLRERTQVLADQAAVK